MRAVLMISFLFAAVLQAGAQDPNNINLIVERRGGAIRVSLEVRDVSAYTVLARMAAAVKPQANYRVDPRALVALQEARLPMSFDKMLLGNAVSFIGGAIGLHAVFDPDAGILSVGPEPGNSTPADMAPTETGYVPTERQEFLRKSAISFLDKSLLLPGIPDWHESLYQLAMMHLRAGEWEAARSDFTRFAEHAPDRDERKSRAWYLGGACAVRKTRTVESVNQAKDLLLKIPELDTETSETPEKLEAYLLLGRILMQEAHSLGTRHPPSMTGPQIELEQARLHLSAKLRLGRVMLKARGTRLEALALLLKTEIHYRLNEMAEAIATLEKFHVDMQRRYPDLAGRLPFIRGLCLYRNEDLAGAVISLITAYEQDRGQDRQVRAGLVLGRIWLELGQPVQALGVVQGALEKNAPGETRTHKKLLFLRARIQRAWEARDLAIATLKELLEDLDPSNPAGVDVNEVFKMLADMMFEDGRFKEAKEVFDRFVAMDGFRSWGRFMSSRCAYHMEQYEQALKILDGIAEGRESGIPDHEIFVLRGRIYTKLGEHSKAALALTGWRARE